MISIIVPVYNAEKYLNKCIDSIKKQTYSLWECILVNDGSTDSSESICEALAKSDERIRFITTENAGAAAARNRGVKEARGEWIAYVDCDDLVAATYLEYLLSLTKEFKADLAVCGYQKVYHEIIGEASNQRVTRYAKSGVDATKALLYQRDFLSVPWGMLSKKVLWNQVSFPEGTKAEDMGTIYRLFLEAKNVAYGGEKLYYYFQRPENTMFSTQNVRNIDYYKHSRQMINVITEKAPEIREAAISRHFAACFQIISESSYKERKKELCRKVYRDIRHYRMTVWKDRNAKMRNRGAAILSVISIQGLHLLVRLAYRWKIRKL